ncbi:hypothetical protein [Streptomyces sp. NPDC002640]
MTRPRPTPAEAVTPERRLGQHLLAVVRQQDAAIPAHRRAPRTVAEMQARLTAAATAANPEYACGSCGRWHAGPCTAASTVVPVVPVAGACGSCGGAGGRVEDTSSDGVTRQTWRPCTSCGGTGSAR